MRIAILCGGPSAERGISLNSGRSLMDHLTPLGWEIVPFYCDTQKNFYQLSPSQIYSNTPSDFDFKLAGVSDAMDKDGLVRALKNVDLVFPAIHGALGEDGELQELLEAKGIPFVGSPSAACRLMFDKGDANSYLARHGFATLPFCLLSKEEEEETLQQKIEVFFAQNHIKKAVLKPSAGGSSLGVTTTETPAETLQKLRLLFAQRHGDTALLEPFCEGQEFTVLVVQNKKGQPVSLIPTEIELTSEESSIFSFRHKYLPTCHVSYHCPPRFSDAIVCSIQKSAEALFSFFGMRDFARLDGWLFPDGRILFSDFNPISGMEQNSFLFIQGSRIGLSHGDILSLIVQSAATRYGLPCEVRRPSKNPNAQKVNVLFGGETAERQVSLMSGTNVWLKLLHHPDYAPEPYLLSLDGDVWKLPYTYTLKHTVEEILYHCKRAATTSERLRTRLPALRERLGLPSDSDDALALPEQMTLEAFCARSQKEDAFVFLGLHGGMGEDGRIQTLLDSYDLAYNGSDPEASAIGADKNKTGEIINALGDPSLIAAPKICFKADEIEAPELWKKATKELGCEDLLIKPQNDGCSTGVVRLSCASDLGHVLTAIRRGDRFIPSGTIKHVDAPIELSATPSELMIEPYILTDEICIEDKNLIHTPRTGWIELTVGILEEAGQYHALTPSITVAESHVLSLEEKFQGGTGVNLTPPPASIMTTDQIETVRCKIEKSAQAIGIKGYARLDLFFNTRKNQLLLIEANTLPGLTAATVIFHQAFAEKPPLCPQAFLALLIRKGLARRDLLKSETSKRCSSS